MTRRADIRAPIRDLQLWRADSIAGSPFRLVEWVKRLRWRSNEWPNCTTKVYPERRSTVRGLTLSVVKRRRFFQDSVRREVVLDPEVCAVFLQECVDRRSGPA